MGYKAGPCSFSKAVPVVARNRENWQFVEKNPHGRSVNRQT